LSWRFYHYLHGYAANQEFIAISEFGWQSLPLAQALFPSWLQARLRPVFAKSTTFPVVLDSGKWPYRGVAATKLLRLHEQANGATRQGAA
jgi:hypothetical protein